MASTHQPLLVKPKTSERKFLLPVFSIATLIFLATLFTIYSVQPNYLNLPPLHQICDKAVDQVSCLAMVSEIASTTSKTMSGADLLEFFLKKSTSNIKDTIKMAIDVNQRINNAREQAGLVDCVELMESSIDRIVDSISALKERSFDSAADAHQWLSTVLTNHVTCFDGLEGSARASMEPMLSDLIARARNSLAIFVKISPPNTEFIHPISQKFPSWVTGRDRRLLGALPNEVKANVVVAKDGSGNYKTLTEAIAAAPNKSKTRYVIYVKKGTYEENVEVGEDKKNIMIVGEGMNSTIITGRRNRVDNSTTFKSATVAAVGDGFIAQDIWFQNTAGPEKQQAVALRVGADQSVINRCRIDAYQDTLYAHSNRQFYRDCFITGTVDFIFGNAAVVFQNCKLVPRKPMNYQANMVTAQGRTDPHQATGTSIQKCDIIASSDLEPVKSSIHSYLGRPWEKYSITVFMQSYIGDLIDPAGWAKWNGNQYLNTLYYGEYSNVGPGAGTSKRVKWAGFHVITDRTEAEKFTVAKLIGGGAWLKSTGVSFTEGL